MPDDDDVRRHAARRNAVRRPPEFPLYALRASRAIVLDYVGLGLTIVSVFAVALILLAPYIEPRTTRLRALGVALTTSQLGVLGARRSRLFSILCTKSGTPPILRKSASTSSPATGSNCSDRTAHRRCCPGTAFLARWKRPKGFLFYQGSRSRGLCPAPLPARRRRDQTSSANSPASTSPTPNSWPDRSKPRDCEILFVSRTLHPAMNRVSACVITLNEEENLSRALASLVGIADEIVVVDSGSIDRTEEIARQHGAQFFTRAWTNYADQKNFAAECATNDWILSLDADEELSSPLHTSLWNWKKHPPSEAVYEMARRTFYLGAWIAHSGWYPGFPAPLVPPRCRGIFRPGPRIADASKASPAACLATSCITPCAPSPSMKPTSSATPRWPPSRCSRRASAVGAARCGSPRHGVGFRISCLRGGFLDGHRGALIAQMAARSVRLKYAKLGRLVSRRAGQSRFAIVKPLLVDLETAWRGGQNQALLLLKGLRELGHAPELVAANSSALGERAAAAQIPVHYVSRGFFRLPAARKIRSLLRQRRVRSRPRQRSPRRLRRLARRSAQTRPFRHLAPCRLPDRQEHARASPLSRRRTHRRQFAMGRRSSGRLRRRARKTHRHLRRRRNPAALHAATTRRGARPLEHFHRHAAARLRRRAAPRQRPGMAHPRPRRNPPRRRPPRNSCSPATAPPAHNSNPSPANSASPTP